VFGKLVRLGALAAIASFGLLGLLICGSAAAAAVERAATGCSTHGLSFSFGKAGKYSVTQLGADGVPCSKARTVARQVALDLLHNRPITLSGAEGLGMSTSSCSGCGTATTTKIALTYSYGKVTVSLTGAGTPSSPNIPLPLDPLPTIPIDPFPTIPSTPPSSGSQHVVTV
jgi:hypothetical protein